MTNIRTYRWGKVNYFHPRALSTTVLSTVSGRFVLCGTKGPGTFIKTSLFLQASAPESGSNQYFMVILDQIAFANMW